MGAGQQEAVPTDADEKIVVAHPPDEPSGANEVNVAQMLAEKQAETAEDRLMQKQRQHFHQEERGTATSWDEPQIPKKYIASYSSKSKKSGPTIAVNYALDSTPDNSESTSQTTQITRASHPGAYDMVGPEGGSEDAFGIDQAQDIGGSMATSLNEGSYAPVAEQGSTVPVATEQGNALVPEHGSNAPVASPVPEHGDIEQGARPAENTAQDLLKKRQFQIIIGFLVAMGLIIFFVIVFVVQKQRDNGDSTKNGDGPLSFPME